MTLRSILGSAFQPSFLQLRYVLLDIFWRFLWLVVSIGICIFAGGAVLSQWASLAGQGPDLARSNPIIVLAALRQFWEKYGVFLLTSAGLLLLTLVLLWIFLEALFRGGWKGFWTYLGTGIARSMLLFGTLAIFLILSTRGDSRGILLVGVVVVAAMWFLVGMLESVVRRNAVELLATDLPLLSGVFGLLRFAEAALAFVLFGSAAAAWMRASEKGLVAIWFTIVLLFWMTVQSYLVAVRYSAIDIMRRNGVAN